MPGVGQTMEQKEQGEQWGKTTDDWSSHNTRLCNEWYYLCVDFVGR